MERKRNNVKPEKLFCNNCGNVVTGVRDESGAMKVQCSRCGTLIVSRIVGRRHVRMDVFAPQGQELMDDDY